MQLLMPIIGPVELFYKVSTKLTSTQLSCLLVSQGGITRVYTNQSQLVTAKTNPRPKPRKHHQQGDIPSKLASPASLASITSKVASPTRWHHQQGGIPSKLASPAVLASITIMVASPAEQHPQQGGITSRVICKIYASTYAKY